MQTWNETYALCFCDVWYKKYDDFFEIVKFAWFHHLRVDLARMAITPFIFGPQLHMTTQKLPDDLRQITKTFEHMTRVKIKEGL